MNYSIEYINTNFNSQYIYAQLSEIGKYGILYDENHITEDEIPTSTSLLSCYPNPFNPNVTIQYNLESKSEVMISIYNLLGRKIITLENSEKEPGENNVIWNGVDDNGNLVSSGVYFVKMQYENNHLIKKITLMK